MTEELRPFVVVLVGALVTAFLAHGFTSRRESRAVRRAGAANFRAAVLAALPGLYPLPTNWPADINASLRAAFPVLQSAVE